MWVSSASRPRAAVGVAGPCGGVSRVVGKAGDGDACWLVRGVAEPDVAGLAGCLGYRRGAAHGGDLLGVLAPLQQRSYLGDQRGETHGGHARQRSEQRGFGMRGQSGCQLAFDAGDLGVQQADLGEA